MLRQFELVEIVKSHIRDADEDLINRAYVMSMLAHGSQKRASGDPYFSAPIETAGVLAKLGYDEICVASALLSHVIEDTPVTVEEIRKALGDEVADHVERTYELTCLARILSEKNLDGKSAEEICLFMSDDVSHIAVYIATRVELVHSLEVIKERHHQKILHWNRDFVFPLAVKSGLLDLAHIIKEGLSQRGVAVEYPLPVEPSKPKKLPSPSKALDREKHRIQNGFSNYDKEEIIFSDSIDEDSTYYVFDNEYYNYINNEILKDVLPKYKERVAEADAQLTSRQIKDALNPLGLPGVAIDAAAKAAMQTMFKLSSKVSPPLVELPRRTETADGRTFFVAADLEPIPLYGEREDKTMDAIAFYEHYWRPYENAGLLNRADLKHFNESLISAIRYQCKRDRIDPETVLPPTVSQTVDEEIAATGLTHRDIRRFARHLDRRAAKAREIEGPP